MEPDNQIGSMIRLHRRAGQLTQAELARMAGVGKTVVFDIEKGKRSVQLDTLLKILDVLNIKLQFTSPLRNDFSQVQSAPDREAAR